MESTLRFHPCDFRDSMAPMALFFIGDGDSPISVKSLPQERSYSGLSNHVQNQIVNGASKKVLHLTFVHSYFRGSSKTRLTTVPNSHE